MNKTVTIALKELKAYFDSLIAYIMLILFLGFSGFFTWLYGSDVFFSGQASLDGFFNISYWTLFFFIPALTMRLLAEENHSGTLELLLTKPVNQWQVVAGKFVAALSLICIALLLTFPYVITVASLGNLDQGAVITGYFGLVLMSATYISIGLFASSLSGNQIVAFLFALTIGIFFHIIFQVMAANLGGLAGRIFDYLSLSTHFGSISRGVIDFKDIVYFVSITFVGLVATEYVLLKKKA